MRGPPWREGLIIAIITLYFTTLFAELTTLRVEGRTRIYPTVSLHEPSNRHVGRLSALGTPQRAAPLADCLAIKVICGCRPNGQGERIRDRSALSPKTLQQFTTQPLNPAAFSPRLSLAEKVLPNLQRKNFANWSGAIDRGLHIFHCWRGPSFGPQLTTREAGTAQPC